ncbi:MAG: ribosome silencing factor [Candidatus Amoebophilus sp. 36-38]|nr:MAG: ribosome silencing factor [Candidatus Amoebophilus sp. 36-38]
MAQITRKNGTKIELVNAIVEGMQDKKAQEISVLNLSKIGSSVADYFIICSGQSNTQIEAIADNIIETSYKKAGQRPWKQEGFTNKEWVLIDYVDVVVHIFQREKRELYALDMLWGDAETTHF